MSTRYDKKVNDLLLGALRKVNGYSDDDGPDIEKINEAREAYNVILDDLENEGRRFFRRVWRQKVLSEPSFVLGSDGNPYRAIVSHDSPNATEWSADTTYDLGDLVLPSTENGFYYKLTAITDNATSGDSGSSEPTFPENQNDTVSDNVLTWTAIPDTKPVIGKNWTSFWKLDSTAESTLTYARNTSYKSQGEFKLEDDEIGVERAFYRLNGIDYPLGIIRDDQYGSIPEKFETSDPMLLYLDHNGNYDVTARIYPQPIDRSDNKGVIHILATLRGENPTEGTDDVDFPDNWFSTIMWLVVTEIQSEYSVELNTMRYNDNKAQKKLKKAMGKDKPKTTEVLRSSCYGEGMQSEIGFVGKNYYC